MFFELITKFFDILLVEKLFKRAVTLFFGQIFFSIHLRSLIIMCTVARAEEKGG
jgi:hypothetical protein